ncbi:MAG: ACP S-malonyltransferase [Agarilytica sp.]
MISYIFPGQGSQFKGMGCELFDLFPRQEEEADAILGYSIRDLCCEDRDGKLNHTQYTQPAIYVVSALSYLQTLQKYSMRPSYVAGHSLGEYNALNAAGALSFGDGLRLVKKRGELMSQAKNGAMAAILNLSEEMISTILTSNGLCDVDIANYNTRTQTVISGASAQVSDSQQFIESAGGVFIPINTSGAFHSRLMRPAAELFAAYISTFDFGDMEVPVISNVTARPYKKEHIVQNLSDQITGSVLWFQIIEYLMNAGVKEFREVGAGDVLTKLVLKIKPDYDEIVGIRSAEKNKDMAVPIVEGENNDLNHIVEEWNKKCKVGESVQLNCLAGDFTTRSPAINLFGFRPVIYLNEIDGYLPLSDIRK